METIYMSCAAIGGTLIVCQFLLAILGLGGHHDVGGGHDLAGHDAGGHHEVGRDHDADPNWFFSQLTGGEGRKRAKCQVASARGLVLT